MNINNFLREETDKLIKECHMFFAFSHEQLKEGLDNLKANGVLLQGEKVTDIGAGGFMPSKFVEKYIQGQKDIDKEYKKLKKDEKAKKEYILYELHNHEVFYTGDLNTFCTYTMTDIPREQIVSVYKSHSKSTCGCYK